MNSALKSFRALSALSLCLLYLFTQSSFGQVLYQITNRNVMDASGAAIPNAKVDVLNIGTGIAKSTLSDERGVYLFSDLQPGTYRLASSPHLLEAARKKEW